MQIRWLRRGVALGAVALAFLAGGAVQAQGDLGNADELPPRGCVVQELTQLGEEEQFLWGNDCESQFFDETNAAYIQFEVPGPGRYTIVAGAPDDSSFIALFNSTARNLATSAPEVDGLFSFSPGVSSIEADLRPGLYWLEVSAHAFPPNDRIFSLAVSSSSGTIRASDLEGAFRPLVGGIRISGETARCTLGFTVVASTPSETFNGIVTNSHCTDIEGVLDATQFQQGGLDSTVAGGERAESVRLSANASLTAFRETADRNGCGQRCGYSDASLFELRDGTEVDVAAIARPREINLLTPQQIADRHGGTRFWLEVDQENPTFRVTGIGSVRRGDVVHKVGATTGWTSGRVTDACSNTAQAGEYIDTNLLCQSEVESERVFQGNGDSGSPVFICVDQNDCEDSNEVILVGLMHSGDDEACAGSGFSVCYGREGTYTPIESVLQDLRDGLEGAGGRVCWMIGAHALGVPDVCEAAIISGAVEPSVAPPLDSGCEVHRLNLNLVDDGTWRRSCRGIDLAPPVVQGDSCHFSVLPYRFSRYYHIEIQREAALQVQYDGADCVRILSRHEHSAGQALGIGAGEGAITSFYTVRPGAVIPQAIEAFPEGSYFIELASRSPGTFALRVCEADQECDLAAVPPTPAPPAPDTVTPLEPPPEPEEGVPVLQVIIGAAVVAFIIMLVWVLFRRSRGRSSGV